VLSYDTSRMRGVGERISKEVAQEVPSVRSLSRASPDVPAVVFRAALRAFNLKFYEPSNLLQLHAPTTTTPIILKTPPYQFLEIIITLASQSSKAAFCFEDCQLQDVALELGEFPIHGDRLVTGVWQADSGFAQQL
jgi:hypothetical protein